MGSDILERKMNDILINKNRSMNKLQVFFVQRWLEILNTNTHSTYSVHYLNSHEALKEILLVCDDLINGEIRNENHLRSVIHEARTIIEKDDIFQKKANPQYRLIKNALGQDYQLKNIHKLYALNYQVSNVLSQIKVEPV